MYSVLYEDNMIVGLILVSALCDNCMWKDVIFELINFTRMSVLVGLSNCTWMGVMVGLINYTWMSVMVGLINLT